MMCNIEKTIARLRKNESGFSIMDVMFGILIVAILAFGLLEVFSDTKSSAAASSVATRDLPMLVGKISELGTGGTFASLTTANANSVAPKYMKVGTTGLKTAWGDTHVYVGPYRLLLPNDSFFIYYPLDADACPSAGAKLLALKAKKILFTTPGATNDTSASTKCRGGTLVTNGIQVTNACRAGKTVACIIAN